MNRNLLVIQVAFKRLIHDIFSIVEGTDVENTIEGIKRDISFRGHSAYILMLAILIASIGLNANSTAVIIGAMLISPLMGPILGVGLAIGINDSNLLLRSLKNLLIAVGIALFTSTVYFLVTPLSEAQSELLSRTKPTILDLLVALFGGFAGIIAGSRKEKSNVIPGVAIATALMPPLCTAGFGLAHLNMEYFLGAFYLFFINSVFISLSTFLGVKMLRFPTVKDIDKKRIGPYRILLATFVLVTAIPSIIIFINIVEETSFRNAADKFINDNCRFDNSELINKKITYTDTLSTIDLYYLGENIPESRIEQLNTLLPFYGLSKKTGFMSRPATLVRVFQEGSDFSEIEKRMSEINQEFYNRTFQEMYRSNLMELQNKDTRIRILESELHQMRSMGGLPFDQIRKEIEFQFVNIEKFAYGISIESPVMEFSSDSLQVPTDTIPVIMVQFKKGILKKQRDTEKTKLEDWLRIRLNLEKIRAIEYN